MKQVLSVCLLLVASAFAQQVANQTATQSVTIKVTTVNGLTITAPSVIPDAVIVGSTPQPYAGVTYTVSGGTPPYKWGIFSGSLPSGLTLSSSGTNGVNGVISGTPALTAITSTAVIQVTDSSSTIATIKMQWSPVTAAPPVDAYNIYRSVQSGGPYTKLGSASNTSYTDYPPRSVGTAFYVAKAHNVNGEGPASSEGKAVIPQ